MQSSSFRKERLRRLHERFLDCAEKLPFLRFIAVTAHDPERSGWPLVPQSDGDTLGLYNAEWREVINQRKAGPYIMVSSYRWLRIDGLLWQGVFFWENGVATRATRGPHVEQLEAATAQFDAIAHEAAGHFEMPASPDPLVEFPLMNNPARRWLEMVCRMPFVELDDRGADVARRVPGNVFTASARTIESLADSADLSSQLKGDVAVLFARRAWHILAAVHRAAAPYNELTSDQVGQLMRGWLGATAAELETHEDAYRQAVSGIVSDQPRNVSDVWGKSWHEAVWKLTSTLVELAWNTGLRASRGSADDSEHWGFLKAHWLAVADALGKFPVFDFSRVEAEIRVEAAAWRQAGRATNLAQPTPHQADEQDGTIPVREATQSEPSGAGELTSAVGPEKLGGAKSTDQKPFSDGQMVFFQDRVELCGVDICSGRRCEQARKVLDLLRQKRSEGTFVAYSGDGLAESIGSVGGQNSAASLIRDLRTRISDQLRDEANIKCGRDEVILSGGPGYRLNDAISVHDEDYNLDSQIRSHGVPKTEHDVPDGDGPNVPNDPDPDVPDVPDGDVAARRNWILQELGKERKMRAPDIAKELDCSPRTVKRDLRVLTDEGRIEFTGASRTGHYRLKKGTSPR